MENLYGEYVENNKHITSNIQDIEKTRTSTESIIQNTLGCNHVVQSVVCTGEITINFEYFDENPNARSFFGHMIFRIGKHFASIYESRFNKRTYPIFYAQRLGEMTACGLIGFTVGFIIPFLLFNIFQLEKYFSIIGYFIYGGLFSFILYFTYIILRESLMAMGEIEIKLRKQYLIDLYSSQWLMCSGKLLFLGWLILIGLGFLNNEIHISKDQQLFKWISNYIWIGISFIYTITAQIFIGFGAVIYSIWTQGRYYPKISTFKTNYSSVILTLERFAEIAIYIVLFLVFLYLFSPLMFNIMRQKTTDIIITSDSNYLYRRGSVLAVVGPLTWYFVYLGKSFRRIKETELERIYKLIPEKKYEEKTYLLEYSNSVRKSGRWITSIEFISRALLLGIIGIPGYLIGTGVF